MCGCRCGFSYGSGVTINTPLLARSGRPSPHIFDETGSAEDTKTKGGWHFDSDVTGRERGKTTPAPW